MGQLCISKLGVCATLAIDRGVVATIQLAPLNIKKKKKTRIGRIEGNQGYKDGVIDVSNLRFSMKYALASYFIDC